MRLLQYTRLIIATCLLSVGLSSQAAVVHIVDNGQLIGATGVEVGGALYDVAFKDGTFDSLYPSGIPAFHSSETTAISFAQALLDQVFIDLRGPLSTRFDFFPTLTSGCDFQNTFCQTHIPYEADATTVSAAIAYNDRSNIRDQVFTFGPYVRHFDLSTQVTRNYAVFTSVSAVPEPSTYAMLAAGLLILAGFSSRSNRV